MSFKDQRVYRKGRRAVVAYCTVCEKKWEGLTVQGVAARHTDATGHKTVVEVVQYHIYRLVEESDS